MQLMDAMMAAGVDGAVGNVSAWCRENGVDRRTFYRHRARIRAEGEWRPRPRRPRSSPHATPPGVVAEVVRLRAALAPDNGADFIRDALAAGAGGWAGRGRRAPSRATVNRILKREGLLEPSPRKRPRSSYRRFSYARPRDCYQVDATEVRLAGGGRAVVFEVLDDCTRALVASVAAPAETAAGAVEAITRAAAEFGAPAMVLSDNGAAFTARPRHPNAAPGQFARAVAAMGSRLIHSSPYHPQTCGKAERHHQTFKRWLDTQPHQPATPAELQTACDAYQRHYNTRRHSALGRRTPCQAWQDAPAHGGPTHPPAQHDATVHDLKVSQAGDVYLGRHARVRIGAEHAGHRVTVIRDGDRATAYTADGRPIGHLTIDPAKTYQGKLTPAA